jgi:hypothetical protein
MTPFASAEQLQEKKKGKILGLLVGSMAPLASPPFSLHLHLRVVIWLCLCSRRYMGQRPIAAAIIPKDIRFRQNEAAAQLSILHISDMHCVA